MFARSRTSVFRRHLCRSFTRSFRPLTSSRYNVKRTLATEGTGAEPEVGIRGPLLDPSAVWTQGTHNPYVLIAPARYVQGPDTFDHIGRYLQVLPSKNPAVVLTKGRFAAMKERLDAACAKYHVKPTYFLFNGETSFEEANRIMSLMEDTPDLDSVIAVGGGKCLDLGKVLAHWRQCPMVSVPTIASNDAPCSSLAVMYTPEGELISYDWVRKNPDLVVVDSAIVAKAPVRYFVAGIGDAMATCFEALTCYKNPKARNPLGANITLTALALGELCKTTLYEYGVAAKESVEAQTVSDALEKCIEANTLLSGMGFESGGIAMAHTVAGSLTAIERIDEQFLHGEMVAVGTVTQLLMERMLEEAERCALFLKAVGLPYSFQQLGLDAFDPETEDMKTLITAFMGPAQVFRDNVEFTVTAELAIETMQSVESLAQKIERPKA